jgi:putative tricarboxylic transport membrane protein
VRGPWHQFAVAAGVAAIGATLLVLSRTIEGGAGYAGVSPRFFPVLVGVGLVLIGAALCVDVWRHGFIGVDEAAEAAVPMDWASFGWISAALIVAGLTIEKGGFVIACTALFMLAARGFNSRRYVLNFVLGLAISIAIYAAFNYGLGLTLPAGLLKLPT